MLATPDLNASAVYNILHPHTHAAIRANFIASDSPVVHSRIKLFLEKLRHVKPALGGNDLQTMGINPGPQIREILDMLRAARLDGKVSGKEGEKALVSEWKKRRA